jgi:hypothetical protein
MAVTTTTTTTTTANTKKLTKVISTKLSVQDYNLFQILTNLAYQHGEIKEATQSELLRYIIVQAVNELRSRPGFSALQLYMQQKTQGIDI